MVINYTERLARTRALLSRTRATAKNFRHRLGHGIGMDVHKPPFLTSHDKTILQNGMTFTDEPSIILDDKWMVRVEDVFVVRENGGEALSDFSRELMVVA